MSATVNKFSIAQAAAAVGISAGVLRMWEIRYGWPRPFRDQSGYRVFTIGQVEEIQRVAAFTREGFSIRDLIVDGQPKLPERQKSKDDRDRAIADLRAQVALLIQCLTMSPSEYWTAEALAMRIAAIARCDGGQPLLDQIRRLEASIEQSRAQAIAGSRPVLESMRKCGALEYLREHGIDPDHMPVEDLVALLWVHRRLDVSHAEGERDQARAEHQTAVINATANARKLEEAQRALDRVVSRDMATAVRRAEAAEAETRRLQRLLARGAVSDA